MDESELAGRVNGQVRTRQGVLRFDDHGVLRQWILDGQVTGDDTFTLDGARWQKVRETKELQKFLEIAAATRDVSEKRPAAPAFPGSLPDLPGPPVDVDATPNNDITRPFAAAAELPPGGALRGPPDTSPTAQPLGPANSSVNNPQTLQLEVPQGADPNTGFSLGDLPSSQTGTWGAPDIALLVQKQRESEAQTPNTLGGNQLATQRPAAAPRKPLPTGVWIAAGVVAALVVVGGGLAFVLPELFGGGAAAKSVEVQKALTAAKQDDAAVIDALLASLDAQSKDAGANADVAGAAALLHIARARLDAQAVRLAQLLAAQNGGGGQANAPPVDPDKHRVAAYKQARRALASDDASPAAALAMALYQAERGAGAEMETDATRALELAKGGDLGAVSLAWVEAELAAAKLLLDTQRALDAPKRDVAGLRSFAASLDAVADDDRAHRAAMVVRLTAATALDGEADADLDLARSELDKMKDAAATDPRVPLATQLAKALSDKLAKATKTPPPTPTPTPAADAGPAVVKAPAADAGPAVALPPKAGPDGGPAGVVDAGPPETYESAMSRAKLLSKQGKPGGAAKAYQSALKLKPDDIQAQLGLGWAYIELSRHEPAAQQFQRVITKDAGAADAYMGLGEALRALGRTEDAKNAFQKYIDIAPNGRDAAAAENAIRQLE
jgi:tetratricopeptide (TPR) repeat protein